MEDTDLGVLNTKDGKYLRTEFINFTGFLKLSTVDTWDKNNSLSWGSHPVQECLAAFLNSVRQMPGAPPQMQQPNVPRHCPCALWE